jgi:hypothetical protein
MTKREKFNELRARMEEGIANWGEPMVKTGFGTLYGFDVANRAVKDVIKTFGEYDKGFKGDRRPYGAVSFHFINCEPFAVMEGCTLTTQIRVDYFGCILFSDGRSSSGCKTMNAPRLRMIMDKIEQTLE